MPKLNVLITGSTGYIGVQLIKLLIKHKNINIKYLCGNSSAGKKISSYDNSLKSKKLPKITKYNKKYLNNVDIVMILRLQRERMQGSYIPSAKEYFKFYGLDREKLNFAKRDALVMHPGPINRGVEIDSELADDINRTLILEQVELGVAIRMSVIEHLLYNLELKK